MCWNFICIIRKFLVSELQSLELHLLEEVSSRTLIKEFPFHVFQFVLFGLVLEKRCWIQIWIHLWTSTSYRWKRNIEIQLRQPEKRARTGLFNVRSSSSFIPLVSFRPPIITSPADSEYWSVSIDFWLLKLSKIQTVIPRFPRSFQHAEMPSEALKIAHYEIRDRVFGEEQQTREALKVWVSLQRRLLVWLCLWGSDDLWFVNMDW